MFHVNEACEGKGVLTVSEDGMVLHISMPSKNVLNLYVGMAEDAASDEENWLQPVLDTVTYQDGMTEEVYGFDIPVAVIGEDFQVALIGKKGVWYDHVVSVNNPEALDD